MFGTVRNNFSKVFDCLPHDIFNAKLYTYGLNMMALEFI